MTEIAGERMRLTYRCKEGQKITKKADGAFDVEWNGKWQWRCLMDKKLPIAPLHGRDGRG